ncbi:MAG: glycine dehydrogenase (aminomethyl-transferring), partial [Gemmatimonadetes bacterium]|nr:glycine dehydrogenase (aminomethyl-transferring) [Gemmatimonadota bacterium]
MLQALGRPSLDALIDATVPPNIRFGRPLALPPAMSEQDALAEFKAMVSPNQVWRSFIGQGYYGTHVPAVIQRDILENPGWYTAYTPYQAEIAQGRLEALLNFQTTVIDLTGLPIASASLLDEATAAAESMQMVHALKSGRDVFLVADDCHPQTIDVVQARAAARGITVKVQPSHAFTLDATVCGVLIQYPNTFGAVEDYRALCDKVHGAGALVVAATDLLALTLLTPPGEWGADVAIGNAQRFGVPYGYGGPHAAFLTTKDEFKRLMPGRIIGVSRDAHGRPALRMALGTREQHIRREKATSNICTAQVLLAVMSGMYAVWHGPDGLARIARRVHHRAEAFAAGVRALGHAVKHDVFFDTVRVAPKAGVTAGQLKGAAEARQINLRYFADGTVGVAMGETTTVGDLADLL